MANALLLEIFKNIFKGPSAITDNFIFRLHYKFTFRALLFGAILIFCYQFFGDSVRCSMRSGYGDAYMINEYCKFGGIFTLPGSLSKKVGYDIPYPGIDKYREGQEVMEHTYYPFVCYVLFLQALLFRVPHFLWRKSESGRMEALVKKLKNPMLGQDESLLRNLVTEFNHGKNQCFAMKFLFCEVLNFVNVILQLALLDKFLGGQFSNFGADVVRYINDEQKDKVDPRVRVFPLMASCKFYIYGSSGDVQRHDGMCVLKLNPIHEKIFFMMWFWFFILIVMGGCVMVCRVISLCSLQVRLRSLRCVSSFSSRSIIKSLVPTLCYGEWFSLYLLANNIDDIYFQPFLLQLNESRTDEGTHDSAGFHITEFFPKLSKRNNLKSKTGPTSGSAEKCAVSLEDMNVQL